MKKRKNPLVWFAQNWEESVSMVAAFVMLTVCSINVFSRYVLKHSLAWSSDVCIICLIYVTFIGGAAAYKRNMHFGMDFLIDHLPKNAQYIVRVAMTLFLVAVFGYLTYLSGIYTLTARKLMNVSRIPYKVIDLSAVLGFASMTAYSVIFLIEAFTKRDKFMKKYARIDLEAESKEDGQA